MAVRFPFILFRNKFVKYKHRWLKNGSGVEGIAPAVAVMPRTPHGIPLPCVYGAAFERKTGRGVRKEMVMGFKRRAGNGVSAWGYE